MSDLGPRLEDLGVPDGEIARVLREGQTPQQLRDEFIEKVLPLLFGTCEPNRTGNWCNTHYDRIPPNSNMQCREYKNQADFADRLLEVWQGSVKQP